MKAKEFKEKYLRLPEMDKFSVIAISKEKPGMYWYHVQDNEEMPKKDFDIALRLREIQNS